MKIVIMQGAFLPVPPIQGGAVEKIWYKMGIKFAEFGCEVIHIGKKTEQLAFKEIINNVKYIRVRGFVTPKSLLKLKILDLVYSITAISKIPSDADIIVTNTFWGPILLRNKNAKKVYVDVQRVPKWQMKLYTHVFRLRANSTPVAQGIKAQIDQKFHNLVTMVPNPLPFNTNIDSNYHDNKENIILYVGRVHPEKGIDLLIKAFQNIQSNYTLRIVGPWDIASGGGGDEYKNYLDSLASNNPKIIFVGSVFDENKLNNEYIKASIFVYPSIAEQGETFGLAPLEAMAWGCVPIVSNLPCFLDFICHNENGLVFNYKDSNAITQIEDCIKFLESDSKLRKEMSQKAIQVNESHSINNIAKLFLNDFSKVNERI